MTPTIADQILSGDVKKLLKAAEALGLTGPKRSSWMKSYSKNKRREAVNKLADILELNRAYIRRRLNQKEASKEQMDEVLDADDDDEVKELALKYWNMGAAKQSTEDDDEQ
ncbi:hypothetical protein CBS101457_000277 [Exobasidium rhododendri]|nr:hypothetical protein CBS101457_000277 [Exobasidium rhododendri]